MQFCFIFCGLSWWKIGGKITASWALLMFRSVGRFHIISRISALHRPIMPRASCVNWMRSRRSGPTQRWWGTPPQISLALSLFSSSFYLPSPPHSAMDGWSRAADRPCSSGFSRNHFVRWIGGLRWDASWKFRTPVTPGFMEGIPSIILKRYPCTTAKNMK